LHALIGVPLFLAITAPWFVVVTQRNPEFPYFFFVHEHFARFLTTVHQRVEPWWYFLPLLLIGVLPWIRAAAGAVRSAWFDPGVAAQFKPRRFLLIFAAVTLIFFSISGSKLAPYILPMMPALAALVGVHVVQTPRLMRTAGWTVVGLLGLVAVGLVVYGTMRNGFMPDETLLWAGGAVAIAALMAVVLWGRAANLTLGPVMSVCVASVLGWQCLLAGYTAMPPVRSAREIANFAGAEIGPQTTLYSVGQYRPTLSVYLRRTLILVGFQGELEFGLQQEPDRQNASPDEFLVRWRRSADAVAFFAPQVYRNYRQLGLPGRVIVSDGTTVVVSRNESGGGEKVPPPS
jgi:4-amino-4-deoxy-L-arabinose transferase-like glycosyltransferase